METLGTRLATRRHHQGLSLAALGAMLGLSPQFLSRIEQGHRGGRIRSDTLADLAQSLACSTDYLLGLTPDPTPRPAARRAAVP